MKLGRIIIFLLWASIDCSLGEPLRFSRDIQPVLSNHCYPCHGPGGLKPKGGLRLDVRERAISPRGERPPAIQPGRAEKSLLMELIRSTDPDEQMPPPETGKKLSLEQINRIKTWIDAEAPYEKHWAFIPPERPKGGDRNIDAIIRSHLAEKNLKPSPPAGKRTVIRRLSFDLTGLPPTIDEVKAFVNDGRPDAYGRLVDRLLQSPHYGEMMTQNWLDHARYADTTGFAADKPRTMWLYRDWVIDAFNQNMPYDRFTIEQLAGDMLPNPTEAQRIATGFNRSSMQALGNNPRKEEFRIKGIVDRIDTTSRVWLGLTISCAECHDHKFDPISQKEYYRLFAIFNNVPHHGQGYGVYGPRLKVMHSKTKGRDETRPVRTRLKTELQELIDASEKDGIAQWSFDENENFEFLRLPADPKLNRTGDLAISAWIKTRSNTANILSKNDWKAGRRSYLFGMGAEGEKSGRPGRLFAWISASAENWEGVEIYGSIPVNDGEWHHVALRFVAGKKVELYVDGLLDPQPRIQGGIPGSIAISERDLVIGAGYKNSKDPNDFFFKGRMRRVRLDTELPWLADPEVKKRQAKIVELEKAAGLHEPQKEVVAQVMEELPNRRKTHILIRGDFENKGIEVQPGIPDFLGPLPAGASANRLGFARWLVDGRNPLTARVFVNRLWQHFFGTGLVRTAEDFGVQGEWPSHPELLDWLAVEFVESGWNIRHMVKRIVESSTYQQQSQVTPKLLARDFYNRSLARGPRYRLAAEQIRDNALAIGGLLNREVGGPSVYPVQPAGLWEEKGQTKDSGTWKTSQGKDLYRRGMYTYWKRMALYPSLLLFDAPTRERCVVKRLRTNTPMQALVTLNDPVFVEAARGFGQRIMREAKTPADRLAFAFECALARLPDPEEAKMFLAFYARQQAALADELEAWTLVASTLLNLDETVSKQ